jgi:CubicO group peptidase (beta-lactamase class C family)
MGQRLACIARYVTALVMLVSGCASHGGRRVARTSPANADALRVSEEPIEYSFPDPDRRNKLGRAFSEIDRIVEANVAELGLPGVSVGIVIDGELAHFKAAGYANLEEKLAPTEDTAYRIGSVTKTFTALTVLSLRDEGALSLDDPFTRFVPEAHSFIYPSIDSPAVSLRHLLTHTSGVPRDALDHTSSKIGPSAADLSGALAGMPIEFSPGTRRSYSTLGFTLLALAVSRAAKKPFEQVMSERVLLRLQMNATGWDFAQFDPSKIAVPYTRSERGDLVRVPDWKWGSDNPGGGLISTMRDMAKYVGAQLDAYPPRNAPETGPVRRSTVRESHWASVPLQWTVNTRETESAIIDATSSVQGYAWFLDRTCALDPIVQHAGGSAGFTAQVTMLPNHGVGLIVLRNFLAAGEAWPAQLTNRVLRALEESGGLTARKPMPKPHPAFTVIVPSLLALMNHWDDARYGELLTERRRILIEPQNERAVFAKVRELHGHCSSHEVKEALTANEVRFAIECERGELELQVSLSPYDHRIDRHVSVTSRGVPLSIEATRLVLGISGLIGRWDEATYREVIQPASRVPLSETMRQFEALRAAHGACRTTWIKSLFNAEDVSTGLGTSARLHFGLECERGGKRWVDVLVHPQKSNEALQFGFRQDRDGPCAVLRPQ